ncbi:hypothetical protein [Mesorhizobium sp. M1B.F.Ca.ET.045.04.1.1]|uniref:hypothetical protein n=1 Tax=Mesorhizobium sp. M1B.F.Ca.ET.045.04.1.1 TaxID=2493673 RepID=UPI000F760431|nr:hypothetical protein [Mesorhizobium sp. M1B.F.Ca.ET.045.04.1.1]AZO29387.1 hypothetical protein EJ071_19670 [Mesorhizobium sp. M1B.F.Ca.ET.045.04.1.1]
MTDRITEALQEALKLCDLAETMTACRADDDYVAGVKAKIAAALSQEPGVAEMVLVPREPTPEMIEAGLSEVPLDGSEADDIADAYRAMIAAAPLSSEEKR